MCALSMEVELTEVTLMLDVHLSPHRCCGPGCGV